MNEKNVCAIEDFLKEDLGRRLKALRGNKMTTAVLGQAERIIKFALDYYIDKGLIEIEESCYFSVKNGGDDNFKIKIKVNDCE